MVDLDKVVVLSNGLAEECLFCTVGGRSVWCRIVADMCPSVAERNVVPIVVVSRLHSLNCYKWLEHKIAFF